MKVKEIGEVEIISGKKCRVYRNCEDYLFLEEDILNLLDKEKKYNVSDIFLKEEEVYDLLMQSNNEDGKQFRKEVIEILKNWARGKL